MRKRSSEENVVIVWKERGEVDEKRRQAQTAPTKRSPRPPSNTEKEVSERPIPPRKTIHSKSSRKAVMKVSYIDGNKNEENRHHDVLLEEQSLKTVSEDKL
nr:hypothetical protein L203_05731 [Cryptococcus depauperatus CBS 7841]